MNLGLGLVAADSYFKEDDARKVREYDQARRDAELSTLAERTASDRSGYQLRDAQNQSGIANQPSLAEADRSGYQLRGKQNNANLGLVDQQTANAGKRLTNESVGLDAAAARQPAENATAANKAEIDKVLSEFNVEDLPRVIAEKKRSGVFSEIDAGTTAIAKLSELVQQGDSNKVITFMNAMNAANSQDKRRADVATVTIEQDPKTGDKVFVAKDAQGADVMRMTNAQMKRVRDSIGKTEYKSVNAGDSLVALKDGKATPVFTAPEKASTSRQNTPAEVQTMEWLISNKVAKDAPGAWEMVRSAREKTRNSFITDYVAKNAMPGQDGTKIAEDAGKIYDQVRQVTGESNGLQSTGSNSTPSATVDPQIKSLLGLP